MCCVCRALGAAVILGSIWANLGGASAAEPEWIWLSDAPGAEDVVLFRKTFELSSPVKSAIVSAACDNELVMFINDQQVMRQKQWQRPSFAGVAERLKQGLNVIAVRGKNEGSLAGLIVRLDLELADGTRTVLVSDGTWKAAAKAGRGWQEPQFDDSSWTMVHSFGKLGVAPWGMVVLDPAAQPKPQATPIDRITLPEGFKVELLYSVPGTEQGSWVSMTVDPRGRLIVSDQDGALYRVSVGAMSSDTRVERLAVGIGQAQGLLYAFDSLYVVVNGGAAQGSGLYRVRDTNDDDQFDEVRLLRKIEGGGEHGPHAVVLAPDGKSLFLVGGNHTKIPNPESTRVPKNWQEDQLLPRMWDAGGHAVGVLAPGGWICRTDAEGKSWELISSGYRNAYDIAFNHEGELFTYDSDMEWDIGAPWYRPTRICHATSGSEFGWRSGSGKWPPYYPDSLPAAADIGPGSPTGVVFGTGAKFPARYQRAFFACDWSYGNIYAVHLTPAGASYESEVERFATAAPLPVTDILIHPLDGAMYFTIGGRRTQSGLYRVTYEGKESTAPIAGSAGEVPAARRIRHRLESFHGRQDAGAVAEAWPYLDHPDRFVRYAARIAIEHQPVDSWKQKALQEQNPVALIHAMVALARCGEKALQQQVIDALGRLGWEQLSVEHRLNLLRAYGLAFTRFGEPSVESRQELLARLNHRFPADRSELNRELARLLIYVEAPGIAARCLDQMAKAGTQEEAMFYAFSMRRLRSSWTPDLQKAYFRWFNDAARYRGGHSFSGFLRNARNEAVSLLERQEKAALSEVLDAIPADSDPNYEIKARPFVREWTTAELAAGIDSALRGRNFQRGRELFAVAACFKCHRFAGEGGIIGPDLTGVGKRFNNQYLLESLIEPSKAISDQYQATIFQLEDGRTIIGKVANLSGDSLKVITNMLDPGTQANVNQSEIESQQPSPVSMMPTGLLNTLQREEILDLLAFLRSGGDPEHEVYQGAAGNN